MSVFSFMTGFIFLNILMLIVFVLRKKNVHLCYYVYLLLGAIIAGACRVIFPLVFSFGYTIRSYVILPKLSSILEQDCMGFGFTLGQFMLFLWGMGIVTTLSITIIQTYQAYQYRKSIQSIQDVQANRVLHQMLQKYSHFKKCPVIVSSAVDVPQIVGILFPKIYLPILDLSDEEMEYIILHELTHARYHDPWIKFCYLALSILFWWNPLMKWFQKELDLLIEIGCDLRVTANMTDHECLSYLSTMAKLMRQLSLSHQKTPVNAIPFIEHGKVNKYKQRFIAVTNEWEQKHKKKREYYYFYL